MSKKRVFGVNIIEASYCRFIETNQFFALLFGGFSHCFIVFNPYHISPISSRAKRMPEATLHPFSDFKFVYSFFPFQFNAFW